MNNETVENLCRKAQQSVSEGNIEEARQYYLHALGLDSGLPNVHYGLATVCYLQGDLVAAAFHFKEVTRLDPLRAGAYINLGAVFNKMDKLDEAVEALRKGIKMDMNRSEGYYNLGLVYRKKGQVDLAIHAYREAARVNNRMPDAHYNLANLYMEKEQFHMALSHYKKALEIRPDWPKAFQGVQQAQAALLELEPAEGRGPGVEDTAMDEAPTQKILDPSRHVDPEVHGAILKELHQVTKESEQLGRVFGQLLIQEIEPALKVLSNCLLHTNQSSTELDQCVDKLEQALSRMRSARKHLTQTMGQVQQNGNQLLQT